MFVFTNKSTLRAVTRTIVIYRTCRDGVSHVYFKRKTQTQNRDSKRHTKIYNHHVSDKNIISIYALHVFVKHLTFCI